MLRVATPADAQAIAALHASSQQATYGPHLPRSARRRISARTFRAKWDHCLAEDGAVVLVTESGGEVSGFSMVRAEDGLWSTLANLHVDRRFHGQGLGSLLLTRSREWALQQGRPYFYLLVLEVNTNARRFYERRGFSKTGAVPGHTLAGHPMAVLRYELTCPSALVGGGAR